MTVKGSIEQAKVFAKVTDSIAKKRAFLEYARNAKRIVGPGNVPRKLIWCPCKAQTYFEALYSKTPVGTAKDLVKRLLSKISPRNK